MKPQVFNYQGNAITFQNLNNAIMLNATQMAKPFNKRPSDYLRNNSTIEFINEISITRNCEPTDLVQVINGGDNSGTWMHEDIAIDFAQWLNVGFKVWCNDRLKELLRYGFTATENKLEEIANNPDLLIELATKLKEERAEKERLANQNQLQEQQLQLQAPKVKYVDAVLSSKSCYTVSQIAKELGMSAIMLNKKLKEFKVQFKQNGTWLLYSKYQDKKYTETKTANFIDAEGNTKTSMQTVWTERGRAFIHHLFIKKQTA